MLAPNQRLDEIRKVFPGSIYDVLDHAKRTSDGPSTNTVLVQPRLYTGLTASGELNHGNHGAKRVSAKIEPLRSLFLDELVTSKVVLVTRNRFRHE